MSVQAEPETFGINPEHCDCCQRHILICNIVVWRHLIGSGLLRLHADHKDYDRDPYNPGDCQCCHVAAERIARLTRLERMFSGMWRDAERHHLRARHLLRGAIRLLPKDTTLPDGLQAMADTDAEADRLRQEEFNRVKAQRDVLVNGLTGILWALEGAPTDPVYARHVAPISKDHPLKDIAKALHKISDASIRALHGSGKASKAKARAKRQGGKDSPQVKADGQLALEEVPS